MSCRFAIPPPDVTRISLQPDQLQCTIHQLPRNPRAPPVPRKDSVSASCRPLAAHSTVKTTMICRMLLLALITLSTATSADDLHFERRIRPLLIERCCKCHSAEQQKGGLLLDSRAALLQGGETGPAIDPANPDNSLLLQAVRQENGLEMPPDGKLTNEQIQALTQWIRQGAPWPGTASTETATTAAADIIPAPLPPNSSHLAGSLQLWLKADSLQLADNDTVPIWPDHSGHGRDLSATKGVREGGTGQPGSFVQHSNLRGRPAVRFSATTGLAASPGNPVDIRGDAPLTITIVMNLQQFAGQPSHSSVFCIGDPAHAADPGRPLAALIEIDQTQQSALDFAGGWGHDATLGPGSFQTLFNKPVILTVVRTPGPIQSTTRFHINGRHVPAHRTATGVPDNRSSIPDLRHRSDIGMFLGKALSWCGGIQGDIGEVVVWNSALSDADRLAVESYLGEKYGLWIDEDRSVAKPAAYTESEKRHWAWQPLRNITPPVVQNPSWARNPIDQFLLAALEADGLQPPAEIDKRTFLRRVTFDLTGLPPTPAELDAFLADHSPQACDTVVDRLLQSRHYGERWGRHWLDLVRYAESTANDANAVMGQAWRYRNYVINAFNDDLPWDQFLIEQLAGDLLPPTDSVAVNTRRIIATGYLMIGPKALAETDKEQSRLDIVDDQIDVTGRAMLGLTLACARCHDHKFDPIRATDYYALAGILRSTEPFQNEVRNATMWWEFPVPQGPGTPPVMVMAPRETQPRNLRVHLRGNRFTLGKIVPRGTPGIIAAAMPATHSSNMPVIDPHQNSSGRLELARWIASPRNPLTARVLTNRVWQLHFGTGIVATPDNFGTRGDPPANPDLLDWLTGQFIQSGWSVRQLHRMIVLSRTYRLPNLQSETADNLRSTRKSSVFRIRRRRLSAEELRDALLLTSGQLDADPGGSESGDFLISKSEDINALIRPNRVAADDEFYTSFRKRSVYLPIVRNMLPDVLALFDAADPNGVTAVRNETTVASQGLFLLNHPFVLQQAQAFAKRVTAETRLSDQQRIELAHQLALGRSAGADELSDTLNFLIGFQNSPELHDTPLAERQLAAWQALCQTLLCSSEFLYVE